MQNNIDRIKLMPRGCKTKTKEQASKASKARWSKDLTHLNNAKEEGQKAISELDKIRKECENAGIPLSRYWTLVDLKNALSMAMPLPEMIEAITYALSQVKVNKFKDAGQALSLVLKALDFRCAITESSKPSRVVFQVTEKESKQLESKNQ